MVSATSAADFFCVGCMPVGMPRPLSTTVRLPSMWIVTSIVSPNPAMCSSTLLSTTSYTRWWRPSGPVLPMNMAGRLRTASRPSSTLICSAPSETRGPLLILVFSVGIHLLPIPSLDLHRHHHAQGPPVALPFYQARTLRLRHLQRLLL